MNIPEIDRNAPVVFKPCVTSTNTILKGLVPSGLPDGFILAAEKQTAGRGRLGRTFESPDGGLYLSMLLYPRRAVEEIATLTPCVAVAVCRAIEQTCGVKAEIKWPNDVLLNGKKLCGILTESSSFGGRRYVIIGIGLNVNTDVSALPPDIGCIAASLSEYTGEHISIEKLAKALITELDSMVSAWNADTKYCLAEYRRKCTTIGCDVTLIFADGRTDAHILDVDDDFALVAEINGEIRHIAFGEVSVRKES